jgi:hypothetical protein
MRNWNAQIARQQMARLLAPGILGFYTHVEITEIFATAAGRNKPANVFTILVAEERAGDAATAPVYVTPKPLRVPLLKGWTFGIKRTIRPVGELVPLFDAYCTTMVWRPRADPAKTLFKPLFGQPLALQNLSQAIQPYVPIQIAALSDRLGNVVVQLPITVLMTKFGEMRESGDFTVSLAWHQHAHPRPLRATCEKQYDQAVVGFMSANAATVQTPFCQCRAVRAYIAPSCGTTKIACLSPRAVSWALFPSSP